MNKYDLNGSNNSKKINFKENLSNDSKLGNIKNNQKKKSTILIDSDIDLKFRKVAASKFHFSQGWYTKAVNEAIKEWLERNGEYFKLDE